MRGLISNIFTAFQINLIQILYHFVGCVFLSLLITQNFGYQALWPIIISTSFPPAIAEVSMLIRIHILKSTPYWDWGRGYSTARHVTIIGDRLTDSKQKSETINDLFECSAVEWVASWKTGLGWGQGISFNTYRLRWPFSQEVSQPDTAFRNSCEEAYRRVSITVPQLLLVASVRVISGLVTYRPQIRQLEGTFLLFASKKLCVLYVSNVINSYDQVKCTVCPSYWSRRYCNTVWVFKNGLMLAWKGREIKQCIP